MKTLVKSSHDVGDRLYFGLNSHGNFGVVMKSFP